jgi:CubicO group peptidase (beta-lactamase class C family)
MDLWNLHNNGIISTALSVEGSTIRSGRMTCILILSIMVLLLAASLTVAAPVILANTTFINATSANAATGGPTDPEELEAFMDGAVNALLKAHHIPGATVAVVKDGRVILSKGYGYADIDERRPVVSNQTLFRVGSVSKLFIWTAAMQLAEEGKLDLDADINTYLKDFQVPATYSTPITFKDLMDHTPGFEDLAIGGRVFVRNATDIMPLDEYLEEKMPARVRPPGELTAYSNYGSALAAYIIEQVSGIPFDKYVEENILQPLRMNNTTFDQPLPSNLASNMSSGYVYSNNAYTAEPFEYLQVWPAGSVSSTSEDMAKFMIAHLQNGRYGDRRIMQEATAEQMHSRLFTNDPRVNGMAYGFWEMNQDNPRAIGHGGDTILFHTLLVLIPESNLGLFISANEEASEPAVYELFQAFMDHYYPVPPLPVPEAVSGFEENASQFSGGYRPTRSAYTNFEKAGTLFQEVQVSPGPNSTLTMSQPGFGSEQWVEVEPLSFSPADGLPSQDGRVFGRDEQGRINYLFFNLNPTTAYEKVAWYDDSNVNYALLGACVLLFLSTLIWPLRAIFNRSPEKPEQDRPSRAARWLAGGSSMLNLLFIVGFASLFSASPTEADFIYTIPAWLIAMLTVALIAAILALVSTAFAALAWKNGYWSPLSRVHYTLVVLALLAFVWWLNNWNLLGFRL